MEDINALWLLCSWVQISMRRLNSETVLVLHMFRGQRMEETFNCFLCLGQYQHMNNKFASFQAVSLCNSNNKRLLSWCGWFLVPLALDYTFNYYLSWWSIQSLFFNSNAVTAI
jgi:hypothetical protein